MNANATKEKILQNLTPEELKMFERTKNLIQFYETHPVEFVQRHILRLDQYEIKQNKFMRRLEPESKKILNAIPGNRFVSVHSGRGVTKTSSLAFAIIWFTFIFARARVFVTGPKFEQLKMTIWAEVNKWLNNSDPWVKNQLEWSSEKLVYKHPEHSGSWFARLTSAREAINMHGVREENMLIVIDEGSGVKDDIYNVLKGSMTMKNCHMVVTGNPNKTDGFFFDSWNKHRDRWFCLHFNSEDSAMVDKQWLEEMKRDYDYDSDMYRIHVRGLEPLGNPASIISLSDCKMAQMREIKADRYLEMGVDPAWRGDDRFTIAIRMGNKLLEIRAFSRLKSQEQTHHVLEMLNEYRTKTGIQSLVRIKVDAGGGYGAAVIDNLAVDTENNVEVVMVNFGGTGNKRYADYGTIMWYGLKHIIHEIELPGDDKLIGSLIGELSTREFGVADKGRIKAESKVIYRKRKGCSPDFADACVLCFAEGEKKVFRRENDTKQYIKEFPVDWDRVSMFNTTFKGVRTTDILHYGAIVLNKDLTINFMSAIYEFYANKLWIYSEIFQNVPDAEKAKRQINHITLRNRFQSGDIRYIKLVGNADIFSRKNDSRPFAEMLLKQGIYVHEAYQYDEFGAIGLGTELFKNKRIVVHQNCKLTQKQLALWSVENGKINYDEAGYCKALLLILSEIRKQMKETPAITRQPDYKIVKVESKKKKGKFEKWLKKR